MPHPLDHSFFKNFQIETLTADTFDPALAAHSDRLIGIFFWGHDCPNCEIAKAKLDNARDELRAFGFKWFHVNVYEHPDLGVRFGLHGIPTFLFFRGTKRLGKITPFPGVAPFFEALAKLKATRGAPANSRGT